MLKRICACYNSRTYGSRWVLVCPAVFKTVAGGEELPRWVRFPHTLANGNRSGSAAPVFVHFNPSASLTLRSFLVSRWRLLAQYKHGVQCRTPSRSDRFNGVTGVARGPKGRNRNLPWPPGKKGYKVACSAFCLFYSLRLLVSLASTFPKGTAFRNAVKFAVLPKGAPLGELASRSDA